jgi:hypothetical protein
MRQNKTRKKNNILALYGINNDLNDYKMNYGNIPPTKEIIKY